MSQEIALYQNLNSLDAIDRVGIMFAKSGMFGCDNENAGKILALICLAERKSPTEISRRYDIIGGKLRTKALASYADFRAAGGKVKWLKTGDDGKEARAEFTFEGQTITLSYTIEQANQAKLVKKDGGWDKNPSNMLRARLLSNAIAMLCPEIFAGGDSEAESDVPAPTINLASSQPQPAAIEVEEVKPPPAPPEPVKPPTHVAGVDVTRSDVRVQMMQRLGEALADDNDMEAALRYLRSTKIAGGPWLGADDDLSKLTDDRLARILKALPAFVKAANKFVAENP